MTAPAQDKARRQPGEVSKAQTFQLSLSLGGAQLVKPRDPNGESAR